MKHDLNCLDPNSIELCIFCELYFDFVLFIYIGVFLFFYMLTAHDDTHMQQHTRQGCQ